MSLKQCVPIGPKTAKIVIIGEAPGREEEITGVPFTGTSGNLLDQALLQAGIYREDCYITNVVKVRPPDNKLDRLHELGHTVEEFYPQLYKELEEVRPNVIIALGATPLYALTEQESITKYRGSLMEWRGIKVIPTIHPAACLRQWQWVYLLQFDLKRAKKESEFPELNRRPRTYIINPTHTEILTELDRMQEESTKIVVDLETYMKSGVFKCIGLADSPDRAICIPLVKGMQTVWSHIQERQIWEKIVLLLKSKQVIAQNAQFEKRQLYPYTGNLEIWMDTMRAHALVYPEFPHGLDFLTSVYTDLIYYKDDGKMGFARNETGSQYDRLQIYNCKDCVAEFEVAEGLEKELKEIGMWNFYHEYDRPLVELLFDMHINGVTIDTVRLQEIKKETTKELQELQTQLNSIVGYELNVKSSKQMKEFLYEKLKLPTKRHKKTNSITANAEAIEELARKHPHPALSIIVKIRGLRTLSETFLNMTLDKDNKIHTLYGLTETGRLSSGKDIFDSGMNLQNIPKGIRDIFIGDEYES